MQEGLQQSRGGRGICKGESQGNRGAAFASKPAPTLDLRRTHALCSLKIKCGSGLAREEGQTFNAKVGSDQALS